MSSVLQISVLGTPTVSIDGKLVTGFVSNKAIALVCYLAVTKREHSRDVLAAMFWGDMGTAQSLKNLRDVLSNLRRLLSPFITISRQAVSLACDPLLCVVDAQLFDSHIRTALETASTRVAINALHEATGLYRGDLLDGFFVAQASEFDDWLISERDRLRQLNLHALHTLTEYAIEHGTYLRGIDAATRLLTFEPWRELTHRQLLLLLTLSGQTDAALAHYRAYASRLEQELGVSPDDETTALYEKIVAGKLTAARTPLGASPALAPLGTLFGRQAELVQLDRLLRDPAARLITITGVGGVGKTRLALEIAWRLVQAKPDPDEQPPVVAFVSLSAIEPRDWSEADIGTSLALELIMRIVDVLGLPSPEANTPLRRLVHYLHNRPAVIVLDGFEHMLPAADVLIALLQQAPDLTLLVTSRVRLNLLDEWIVELEGLSFPTERKQLTMSDVQSYHALQLFQASAQAVKPGFSFTATSIQAAAHICSLVNGIPLGIELAARLVRLLSTNDIAREIELNLSILQNPNRDLSARHRDLRAVFLQSWNLLANDEQQVLRQLAVFRGSFSRQAASAVAGASLPVLAALIDHSLLRYLPVDNDDAGLARYELLDIVRQFADEQLPVATGCEHDLRAQLQGRHCKYYLAFLGARTDDLRGQRQREALAEIQAEFANIRSAWIWAVEQGDDSALNNAVDALFSYCEMRSRFQEGADLFSYAAARFEALADDALSTAARTTWGRLVARQGWFMFQLGKHAAAHIQISKGLNLLQTMQSRADAVFPLSRLAAMQMYAGRYAEGAALCQEALEISRASHDTYNQAIALTILSRILYLLGNYHEAQACCEQSLAIDRQANHAWGMAFTLTYIGDIAFALGDYANARRYFQEALETRRSLNDVRGMAMCMASLGDIARAQGLYDEATRLYQESLKQFRQIGNPLGVARALRLLGVTALELKQVEHAYPYFAESLRLASESQSPPAQIDTLLELSILLAQSAPEQSSEIILLASRHPAATNETKSRAARLLDETQLLSRTVDQTLVVDTVVPDLTQLVERLSRRDADTFATLRQACESTARVIARQARR